MYSLTGGCNREQERGLREADEDSQLMADALNGRAGATQQLEHVLVELADNAEMRDVQARTAAERWAGRYGVTVAVTHCGSALWL